MLADILVPNPLFVETYVAFIDYYENTIFMSLNIYFEFLLYLQVSN